MAVLSVLVPLVVNRPVPCKRPVVQLNAPFNIRLPAPANVPPAMLNVPSNVELPASVNVPPLIVSEPPASRVRVRAFAIPVTSTSKPLIRTLSVIKGARLVDQFNGSVHRPLPASSSQNIPAKLVNTMSNDVALYVDATSTPSLSEMILSNSLAVFDV